jgi:hypothetical protein
LAPADEAVLERALVGVERTPAPPRASYVAELGQRIQEELTSWAAGLLGALGVPAAVLQAVAIGLAVLAGLALLALIWRRWSRWRRRGVPPLAIEAVEIPAVTERDAGSFRAEIEACLAAGRIAQALAAAWWWLARTLLGRDVTADWTSRELALRSGRRDLVPLLRRLDAMAFAGRTPGAAEVRELIGRLEGAL